MAKKKERNKNSNRVIFDYFNVDYAQLREVAQKIDWSEIIKGCNVEDESVAFKKEIIYIRDKYIPKKSYNVSFKAKWITKEVTKCCRLTNKAWTRYVKLKTIEAYDNYKENLRKSVRLNKAAHFEFEKRLSENIVNNSQSIYSYVMHMSCILYMSSPYCVT